MRVDLRATVVTLGIAAACASGLRAQTTPPPQEQAPVFRSGTQTVPVYTTVLDAADDHLVSGLTKETFQVYDNGRLQPIVLFDNREQPVSLVVMLDMSGSMLGNLPTLRRAAVQMFTHLGPGDKAKVGGFGDRITLSDHFTNNVDDLIRSLWFDLEPGGSTPLWNAVNIAMTALAHQDGRRVVLVLSDGKDTTGGRGMAVTLHDLIAREQAEDFMVYSIGLASRSTPGQPGAGGGYGGGGYGGGYGRSRRFGGGGGNGGRGNAPDPGLKELATEAGGGYFELHDTDALGPTFERVAEEIHSQYQLGYVVPELDGRVHTIEVRVTRPDLVVRARRSYVAPRGGGSSAR